jgi:hypothetical protein
MTILHTDSFRPGDPEGTSLEMFEQWLEQARPDQLARFGRCWFPYARWWSCWARIRIGTKPSLHPCGQGHRREPLPPPRYP